ncbi:polyphosphate kinase [Marinobacter bryozoorum]|jgi:polyphosphate kinase 2 (PPK2 family)|uniref:polyphosphate kinase 2 family protein n=1 Tax=Marinobacter bryozoorum TaxID=256324 RepID=UPI0020064954|nr:polyphosphate kinase [Marinobacter bryozoorum]MCK7542572.1 polyphosphate kinase [Marinobacter bryozoorum]
MLSTRFNETWLYDPRKPSLHDYPSDIDDKSVPALEPSLELIGEHQRRLWANGEDACLMVFHGLDASGKDSLVRTLATYMDPAGFHAWSFGRPNGTEAKHDFLWRVVPYLPALGELVAFNRSHHEAVMAERLWPVRDESHYNWQARYSAIRAFEQHLVQEGTTVLKVWLHLSEEEHRQRLVKRLDKPRKRWKFDHSDIEAWNRRDEYLAAVEEAIAATHTPEAPWLILPGDRKPVARALMASILAEQLEALAPDYPKEDEEVLEQYRELLSKDR